MTGRVDCYRQRGQVIAEIGDLDHNRNLKIRTFVSFVLTPVFRTLQPALQFREMGQRGVTPMQYYQEFVSHPRTHGYGDAFDTLHEIRLCRSAQTSPGKQLHERLIIETQATLTGRCAAGPPASFGFEPELGPSAVAGTGRVLHVLTRVESAPDERRVREVPIEIDFLAEKPLDGPFPTIGLLNRVAVGWAEIPVASTERTGLWGVANSDVFLHVNAREYIFATENAITAGLSAADIAVDRYSPTRAQVIFRRPSFVGEPYRLRLRCFRRGDEILSLGMFHDARQKEDSAERASVFLRVEGRLAS